MANPAASVAAAVVLVTVDGLVCDANNFEIDADGDWVSTR